MNISTLDKVPLGKNAIVLNIRNSSRHKYRLMDMGVAKDTIITPLFTSPASDPTAYLLKGTVIALRLEDSRNINVYTD